MFMKKKLSIEILKKEAGMFSKLETKHREPTIFGITDGKAVGTYFEHKFQNYLEQRYDYTKGSSAKGIDFPELLVDMKVTSVKQPQSSCPFKSAKQKIYGLGYSLLVFVYNKIDDERKRTGNLDIQHCIYIENEKTADFQTTTGLNNIVENSGNVDDIIAFFNDRFLPVDEIQARELADEIFINPPEIGYLTISNALQWRLQYSRVIAKANTIKGIDGII